MEITISGTRTKNVVTEIPIKAVLASAVGITAASWGSQYLNARGLMPLPLGKYALPATQFALGALPILYIATKKGSTSDTDKMAAMIGVGAMAYSIANTIAVMAGGVGAGPIFNVKKVLNAAPVAPNSAPRAVTPRREMLLPVTGGGY